MILKADIIIDKQKKITMPKWLKWILGIFATLALLLVLAFLIFSESLPKGQTGPEAEALANKMLTQAQQERNWLKMLGDFGVMILFG